MHIVLNVLQIVFIVVTHLIAQNVSQHILWSTIIVFHIIVLIVLLVIIHLLHRFVPIVHRHILYTRLGVLTNVRSITIVWSIRRLMENIVRNVLIIVLIVLTRILVSSVFLSISLLRVTDVWMKLFISMEMLLICLGSLVISLKRWLKYI